MLGDFWKGLGGRLADRWAAALFSPAFAFWLGGLLAWVQHPGAGTGGWHDRLLALGRQLQGVPVVVQGLYVVVPLIVITLSGLALQQAAQPALRVLEGYWPPGLDPVAAKLRTRLSDASDRDRARLRELAAKRQGALRPAEIAERGRLERRHRCVPAQKVAHMPTRLGNILRAGETRTRNRYGLDPIVCWPRIWLLLPDTSRQEVTACYTSLLLTVQVLICGVLFTVWTAWAWWALPIGLVVAVAAYIRTLSAATAFADLLESCFDLHRMLLYQALRWPAPSDPHAEREQGARLTTYLHAGSRQPEPAFVQTPD
jgi:hypothetical protein